MSDMDGFIPWLLSDFIPVVLPYVMIVAVLVEIAFWITVVILTRKYGPGILRKVRGRFARKRS